MAGALLAAMSRRRKPNNGGAQAPAGRQRPNNGGAAPPAGLGTRIFNAGRQQNNGGAPAPAPGGGAPAPGAGGGARPGVPASPPPGFYDPALDAQVRASGRGLGDLLADQNTQLTRGANDYTTARGDIFRTRDEQLSDLGTQHDRQGTGFDWQRQDLDTGYGRGMDDSRLAEGRTREDYGSAITNLQRGYQRLGGQQSQALAGAGLGGGGAFAMAAGKRAENMSIDRAPIDTNFNRGIADLLTNRGRMTEDYGTNTGRLSTQRGWSDQDFTTNTGRVNAGADRAAGALDLGWNRQQEDIGTAGTRATRENTAFGQDANAQRWFQAQQAGYTGPMPGTRPSGGGGGGRPAGGGGGRPAAGTGGARPPAGLGTRILNAGRRQQRRR